MEVKCKGSATLQLQELTEFQGGLKNRTRTDVDKIITSIHKFGFATPFFIWNHDGINHVLDGHGRLLALNIMKQQGEEIPPLPVVYVDCKDEATARQLLLRITSQYGTMTNASVLEFMQGLEIEVSELALPKANLEIHLPEENQDQEEVDVPVIVETRTKPGDIWQLGDHRLICGDSTKPETIARLMAGETADLLLTDPPYNVDYTGKTKDALKIENDKKDDAAFQAFLIDAFQAANTAMKPGAAFYIWHADSEGFNFRTACNKTNWKIRECLIWNKNTMVLGRQDYQWKHEPCLYGWKEGTHYFTYSRSEYTVIDQEEKKPEEMTKQELLEAVKKLLEAIPTTVINCDKPARSEAHPTMKPIKLFSYLIKNSSKPGQAVLDTFGGSGTTLLACQQLKRRAFTCELDPHYCDVIIQRWENFTGQKAVRLSA